MSEEQLTTEQVLPTEQDSVWKEIIDAYFPEFMAFFFSTIHAAIDWDRGYEFFDKELEKMEPDSAVGRRFADKLIKVYEVGSETETWLLIHLEVQGRSDPHFEERMFIYNYRIFDRYGRDVVSLALLTDSSQSYRPHEYRFSKWGCNRILQFPIVKLIDYNKDWAALEANPNPFAIVVMAQLKVLLEKGTPALKDSKLRLVRMLYERKYTRKQITELFRFIDWLLRLPQQQALEFKQELARYEEEAKMPYITSIERIGIEQGRREGIQEGLQQGIQEGLQQGIQEGLQQGIQEGLQQGIQEGLQQGIQEGLQEGAVKVVVRQIKRRLEEGLTTELAARISGLPLERLEELAEAVFDLASAAALEAWLVANTPSEHPQS